MEKYYREDLVTTITERDGGMEIRIDSIKIRNELLSIWGKPLAWEGLPRNQILNLIRRLYCETLVLQWTINELVYLM